MTGATTASEKFSARLSMAARATPQRRAFRIAADDMGNRGSASGKAALLERVGNIADMPVQAALRDQARGEQSHQQKSETQAQQLMLHDDRNCGNDRQNDEECNSTGEPPQFLTRRFRD